MTTWTTRNIPDQTGKLAIVTGSTGGTGFETALELSRKGSDVIIAARSATKGDNAMRRIRAQVPGAQVRFEALDLADQASVAAFADRILWEGRGVNVLVNNAGVMALPEREETVDGFEKQLATNYLAISPSRRDCCPFCGWGRREWCNCHRSRIETGRSLWTT